MPQVASLRSAYELDFQTQRTAFEALLAAVVVSSCSAPGSLGVPPGAGAESITAYGASGGGYTNPSYGYPGGLGAAVKATIPVQPGQMLIVLVGSKGIIGGKEMAGGAGFNGGGGAYRGGFGGGGSSDVRIAGGTLADRILVAGGGGGGSSFVEMSATNVHQKTGGAPRGDGLIVIVW